MRILHVQSRTARLSGWLLLVASVAGCGTAEYNRLSSNAVGEAKTSAPFRTLFAPTQLADTPIKLRVPMVFPKSYTETSAHPVDGNTINPDRVQPPFLKLPGFKVCYEGKAKGQAGAWYCYLAALPGNPGDADRIQSELLAKLKDRFKEAPAEWEKVDCTTPNGKAVPWKRIKIEAPQPFLESDGMKVVSTDMPAEFQLWVYDAQNYVVLVAWRSPTAALGPAPAPPAVADRPDLGVMPTLTAGSITVDGAVQADAVGQ